ncbi:MAG TPA: mechanosensitive ion channel domain-containing protein [Myxococcota bacterium]
MIARSAPTVPRGLCVLALVALLGTAPAGAQEAAPRVPDAAAGAGAQPQTPEAAAAQPESADARAKLAEIENQIAQFQAREEEWAGKAAEYDQARVGAPQQLVEIEGEIERLQKGRGIGVEAEAPIEVLETQLLGAEQDLSLARKQVTALDEESARRSERRKRIPELLSAAKERLRQVGDESPPPAAEPRLAEAWEQLVKARRAALEREIQAYEAELASYDARGQLLVKRLDRATLSVVRQEARLEALRGIMATRQRGEAERAAEIAQRWVEQAQRFSPDAQAIVRQLAEQNAQLAQQRTGEQGLLVKIEDTSEKLDRLDKLVEEIDADYARLVAKVEAAGLTDSTGLLLRKHRSEVPDVGKYRRFIRMRQQQISEVQLQQIELGEQRRDLTDIDRALERAMAQLDPSLAPSERAEIEDVLRDLLETKQKYLDVLIGDYETYFQKLVDFDARQQQLIGKTEQLLSYIDQRILWIPSGESVRPELATDGWDAITWFSTPRYWGQIVHALGGVAVRAPLLSALVVVLFALSQALRPRVRARIQVLGSETLEPTCTRQAPTWETFGLSLLMALPGPGLLAYLGWSLGVSPNATQFVRCFAHGALAAALAWFAFEIPLQLLRGKGLAEAHFGWPSESVRGLRRHLAWFTAIAVPTVFAIQVFEMRGEEAWKESIGRLAFLLLMGATTVFTHLVLRERTGALWCIAQATPELSVRRWLWRMAHGLAIAVTVLLGVAAVRGYYWTSLQLASSYYFTLIFLFLLLVALRLCVRWSLLARRRLVLRRAEEAREKAAARREQQAPESGVDASELAEPEVDLAAVTAQTGRLLQSAAAVAVVIGLWVIWADLLPAAGILREVELWSTSGTVTLEITDATGSQRLVQEERLVPVTLVDLCLAILIAVMTLVVARNLPGLLEISIFRRLQTGTGERYAYATILKYGITLLGAVLALSTIGVSWSNIQWLVAAVGLGLGFGLQEIFANFVSGLIILFERPIRVGDTVTVGDISGTVTRIRIRATWITGFDRKELVVPNKEFVTSKLVNWSLSDAILRVDVPVGIAYGSDTQKAIEVLSRVADETPHVLREPHPQVLFLGFGDSALQFELRVFSPDVEHRLVIRHALHLAIDAAFRAAGIEIAFPQRDVHLRSVPRPVPPPAGGSGG